jgi:transcription antitermination factor NusG
VTGRSYVLADMNEQISQTVTERSLPEKFFRPHWYVLFVRSNQEKRVAGGLLERGVEHLLPCYSSIRYWKDRRVRLDMPLFPGYVFVRLTLTERLKALTVPNVVSLVGRKEDPAVISEEEITWIRSGVAHGQAQPHKYLKAGQRVMIMEGPLAGMQGILLRRSNGARIIIALGSISRAFGVEVDESSVKALGGDTHGQAPNRPGNFPELCCAGPA